MRWPSPTASSRAELVGLDLLHRMLQEEIVLREPYSEWCESELYVCKPSQSTSFFGDKYF